MIEAVSFGEWLLKNYIPISGGWHQREPLVQGRAIPTSELWQIFNFSVIQKKESDLKLIQFIIDQDYFKYSLDAEYIYDEFLKSKNR